MLEVVGLHVGVSPAQLHDIDEEPLGEAVAPGYVLGEAPAVFGEVDRLLAVNVHHFVPLHALDRRPGCRGCDPHPAG